MTIDWRKRNIFTFLKEFSFKRMDFLKGHFCRVEKNSETNTFRKETDVFVNTFDLFMNKSVTFDEQYPNGGVKTVIKL